MNLIALLVFLTLIVQFGIAMMLKKIVKELKIGQQILELSEQLRKKTDALQTAIDNQKKAK